MFVCGGVKFMENNLMNLVVFVFVVVVIKVITTIRATMFHVKHSEK